MKKSAFFIFKRESVLYCSILFGIALAIVITEKYLFQNQGRVPKITYFFKLADRVWRTGSMPRTAYYPPMIMLLVLGLRCIGISPVNPYAFNFCMLALGLGSMYGMAQHLLHSRKYAFWSVFIALLNPYFVWTVLLSRDTGAEFMFLSLLLFLTIVVLEIPDDVLRRKQYSYGVGIVGTTFFLLLSRVTGFTVVLTLIALAVWLTAKRKRRFFAFCGGIFVLFTLLFCLYNYALVGAFALATNSGVNLYIGNHPAYLHGHPHYDIEIFMNNIRDTYPNGENERNQAYFRKAVEFIRADPLAFGYRLIRKSIWHWFNLEKIPNYPISSKIEARTNTSWIVRVNRHMSIASGLAYLLYKLLYVPIFILCGVALAYKKIDSRYTMLYAPMLGLWPLVVLTFPDTRFKICAEVLAIPALAATCLHWQKWHQALKNKKLIDV